MKKSIIIALVVMSLNTVVVAQNLEVLETYYPTSEYGLTDWYPEFDLTISHSGDMIGLYGRLSSGEASYIAKKYPQGEPSSSYYIGGYNGNGGSYYPKMCGFEEDKLLIQISVFGDIIEPFAPHNLISLDLTDNSNHATQWFYTQQSQVKGIWKTDSSSACTFMNHWSYENEDTLYFIKGIDLFADYQYQFDSSFSVNGDTILAIPSVSSHYQKKMDSNELYMAIYDIEGSDNWSSVCVSLDSVIAHADSIFPKSTTMPHLYSTEEAFMALLKTPDDDTIYLWSYNPLSGETSNELIYTSPTGSNELLGRYQSTVLDDEIVLQLPVLRSSSSTAVSNWYGLIKKRISRTDYSILATDTIFIFESQTDIIRHQIDNDSINTHSLIATRTPEYSRIYYYGINNLVEVEEEPSFLPTELAIQKAYPNPFNNQMRITISLPEGHKRASLQIFDLRGRVVWSTQNLQGNSILWHGQDLNGQDLDSGVYLLKLSDGITHDAQKILLLK